MNTNTLQRIGLVACGLWLAVAGTNAWGMAQDGDDWELAYSAFTLAVTLAAGLTVCLVAALTRGAERPRLRTAGLAVGGLGVAAAAVGAWALPLWMSLLGIAFALLGGAAPEAVRRPIAAVAATYLAAPAVQVLSIELFGAGDGAAADIVLFATTAVVIAVLASLSRAPGLGRPAVTA